MPTEFVSAPQLAVTHAHPDHISGLISYVAGRAMKRLAPPKIFLPAVIKEKVRQWITATEAMQEDTHSCELVGLKPGDRVELGKPDLLLEALATEHTLPATGYRLIERRHHIKEQYRGLTGPAIAKARKSGQEIYDYEDHGLIAFTGDTVTSALDHPDFLTADTLVCEMSFIADDHQAMAESHGHVAIQTAAEILGRFTGSNLVLTHFSMRYGRDEIVAAVTKHLPAHLHDRLILWL